MTMDYDALASKYGATDSSVDYDALAAKYGASDKPAPKRETLADTLKKELENTDWGTRNIAALGTATSDLWERGKQLFGKEDRQQIEANKIIADSAPVGAFVGEMISPQSLATMKVMPVLRGAQGAMAKAGQYLGNVGIGAATGAGLAQLKPDANLETTEQGAAGGAIAAGVIAPLVSMAAKGSAWAWDALRGRLGDLKAAQIYRDIVGKDYAAVKAANAVAPENVTAAQAAYGIQNDPLQALGEMAKRNDKETFFRPLLDEQIAKARGGVVDVAGGPSQFAALESQRGAKKALNAEYSDAIANELPKADAGRVANMLRGNANQYGTNAAADVAAVRRLENAGASANDLSMAGRNTLDGAKNLRGQVLSDVAEKGSATKAAESLDNGLLAGMNERMAGVIDRFGTPLSTQNIQSALAAKAANSSKAGDDSYFRIINKLSENIKEWETANGGTISPSALVAIRKNIGNTVESLLQGDPIATKKYTAKLVGEVTPLIDQAIVDAGATNWPSILKVYERGMRDVNRQQMGASLLKQFDTGGKGFVKTVTGDNPKKVSDVFGPGRDNLEKMMGPKFEPLKQAADYRMREAEMLRQAEAGQGGLSQIVKREAIDFRLPSLVNAKFSFINKALDTMEGKINQKSLDRLILAQRSGKDANQLLMMLPTKDRANFLKALIDANGGEAALVAGSAAVQ